MIWRLFQCRVWQWVFCAKDFRHGNQRWGSWDNYCVCAPIYGLDMPWWLNHTKPQTNHSRKSCKILVFTWQLWQLDNHQPGLFTWNILISSGMKMMIKPLVKWILLTICRVNIHLFYCRWTSISIHSQSHLLHIYISFVDEHPTLYLQLYRHLGYESKP